MKHTYKATALDDVCGEPVISNTYMGRGPDTAAKLVSEAAVQRSIPSMPIKVEVEWEAAEHVGIQAGKKTFLCYIKVTLHGIVEEIEE